MTKKSRFQATLRRQWPWWLAIFGLVVTVGWSIRSWEKWDEIRFQFGQTFVHVFSSHSTLGFALKDTVGRSDFSFKFHSTEFFLPNSPTNLPAMGRFVFDRPMKILSVPFWFACMPFLVPLAVRIFWTTTKERKPTEPR